MRAIKLLVAVTAALWVQPAAATELAISFTAMTDAPAPPVSVLPVSPVQFSGVFNFNSAANVDPTTNGLTVLGFNLPYGVEYAFDKTGNTLLLGSDITGTAGAYAPVVGENSWFAAIVDVFGSAPRVDTFVQAGAYDPAIDALVPFRADRVTLSIRGIGSVPEPRTWLLLILGFGALGMVMRRSRGEFRLQAAQA